MHRLALRSLLLPASLCALVAATPAPTARSEAAVVSAPDPLITASPVLQAPTRTDLRRRGLLSDITSAYENYIGSALNSLGSAVPSYVASGVPELYQDFPTGDKVQSSLGLDDAQVSALPTNVLNLDPYGNYTDQGWQIRFHGNVYKQPNTSTEKLNDLANFFLTGTKIQDLPDSEQVQARNTTAQVFVIQQGNVNVSTIHLEPSEQQGASGQAGGGGAVTPSGGTQDVTLPYPTTDEGDFDVFVPINGDGLQAGNATAEIQRLNTMVDGTTLGNGTAYLVPNEGLTFISDIDDILRITRIWEPANGLILNTFAKPFVPWENMPSIYANWSESLPNAHFHYLTTTPEQITRSYMQYIYANYPGGSFDTRPLNFSDIEATLSIRKFLLIKIFETFPQRKFVLVADTSNSDVMKDYPAMATEFPNQVQCIFLRNTSATDSSDWLPYDTSGFKDVKTSSYMFFLEPNDLHGLDIEGGQCLNSTIPQNLTFSYQGLPDGLSKTSAVNGSANGSESAAIPTASVNGLTFWAFVGLLFWQLL